MLQVLQYLARAYYKAGKMKEAKATLLKARRVAPQVVRWRELQYQIFNCGDLLLDTYYPDPDPQAYGSYYLKMLKKGILPKCSNSAWFSNSVKKTLYTPVVL
jgi:hypothetical protein